jgi:hypothetical protein
MFAAEHLIKKGYTSEGKIIMNGGSNGGLLVAACTNQAREGLIGASIADVGVHDLLKVSMRVGWSPLLRLTLTEMLRCDRDSSTAGRSDTTGSQTTGIQTSRKTSSESGREPPSHFQSHG